MYGRVQKCYNLLARVCEVFLSVQKRFLWTTCTLQICSCLVSCETLWTTYGHTNVHYPLEATSLQNRYTQYMYVRMSRPTWHCAICFLRMVWESVNEYLDIHVEVHMNYMCVALCQGLWTLCHRLWRICNQFVTFSACYHTCIIMYVYTLCNVHMCIHTSGTSSM